MALTMVAPPLPPGYTKHHIVFLEGMHTPLPKFDFDHDFTVHMKTEPSQVRERIRDATIIIAIIVPILPTDMDNAPNLRCLAIMATGIGWVDRRYCADKGITVVHTPQSNVEAVGEHFLTLYFSSRRKIPEMTQRVTMTRDWLEKGTLLKCWSQGPPLSCAQETLGIIGYGHLGKRFEMLAKAVGFGKVIIGDRKGIEKIREGRVSFQELLETATTIVISCPREAETINLIDEEELRTVKKECLIINIARGGIVNEKALADALVEGRIFGAATDVTDKEPGGPGSSPLLPDTNKGEQPVPNLVITPHVAWFSQKTIDTLMQMLVDGVNGFVEGGLDKEHVIKNVAVRDGKIYH